MATGTGIRRTAIRDRESTPDAPSGTRRAPHAAIPLGLALACFVIAFLQRPGLSTSDTKINLHVDPLAFLGQIASVWSRTGGLGHVQGGQYSGYLWPMGPFFALGQLLGLSGWLTERLWLGTLLALSAWGSVRLLDVLLDRKRGVAHLVAGAMYALNPYVVVMTSRTTAFLLAYAALPWLLVVTHRGLRDPRRWWWAAAFALITTSTAGGVNATVTAFVLVGPMLFALYEYSIGDVSRRDAVAFGWRTLVATAAASLWWVVPLLVQSSYGLNFLQFTEQVGSIWATTSLTESLRLMGYWPTYLGVGFANPLTPYFGNATTMLFDPIVVAATLLVPALALAGFVRTRRWRYGALFVLMALLALLLMSVGYPNGTPGRRAANFLYDHLTALQFLRTTYKAGPLLALAIAALAGAAAGATWPRLGPLARAGATLATAGALVASALPFFEGRAIELTWSSVPAGWRQAGSDLNRQLPPNSRAVVLPGQAYGYYNWGGSVDPILPSLTTRPVAVRNVPPFDDLHAVDLLWTTDDLVQQRRLLSGELRPLLDLMSARAVITATDDDDGASGAVTPAVAAQQLSSQPGFAHPSRSYGPVRTFPAPAGTADRAVPLPEVRRYDLPARGLVRVEPSGPATIVDGSAEGLADMAALGELSGSGPLFYAGDLSAAAVRRQARAGAEVFITDSNRRRVFVTSRVLQNYGWTVPAAESFSADATLSDPFPARGGDAQTIAVFEGAKYVQAPYDPQIAEFPEHRPFAAFDGNPGTAWLADTTLPQSEHWIEIAFDHPRDVPYLDLLPYSSDPFVRLTRVQIGTRLFAVHPGWNRLAIELTHASVLRIEIARVHTTGNQGGTGVGIAEVRIPGVKVRELLRPPVLTEQALRGVDLSHTPLTYVFERTTAAAPLQRGPAPRSVTARGNQLQTEVTLITDAQDPESGISRTIDPPAARRWTVSGLASVSPTAPDPALDLIAGTATDGAGFSSSGRLEGVPGDRASAAFDGSRATAWVAPFGPGQSAWIAWRTPAPHMLRRLVLVPSTLPLQFPTLVTIRTGSATTGALVVGPGGTVTLPRALRGRSFRLTVVRATGSGRPVVAIAEVRGAGTPAASERDSAVVRGRCGDLRAVVGGRTIALRISGGVGAFDRGQAMSVVQCGGPVALPAARNEFVIAPAVVRPLLVQLRSPAPDPLAQVAAGGGEVLNSGHQGNGSYSGVRVRVTGPSWLVLGESYNRGWQASCNGRSLGPPQVIDAFANGWRIGRDCRQVSIWFAPQTDVNIGYVLGALSCLVLVLVLALRRPPARKERMDVAFAPAGPPGRFSPVPAVAAGAFAGAVFGFLFGLRAGVVIGPAFGLILWRGVTSRTLLLTAGALLVFVVPALYLAFPGTNQGGFDTGYPIEHLGAHWVAVGAFALVALVVARELTVNRRGRRT